MRKLLDTRQFNRERVIGLAPDLGCFLASSVYNFDGHFRNEAQRRTLGQ